MLFPFNIRVYGALIWENSILLSHELILGKAVTKLPGGGLEYGEGLRECLVREFMEETGWHVRVGAHIYTTDFFQVSAFNPNHQVISVYYEVAIDGLEDAAEVQPQEPGQTFSWKSLGELSSDDFSLPIDKAIVPLLSGLHR